MARHDIDPVLQQLVRAIDESGQATVPVRICVHGAMLTGALIAERRYFASSSRETPS
jgi:hypothetical protein